MKDTTRNTAPESSRKDGLYSFGDWLKYNGQVIEDGPPETDAMLELTAGNSEALAYERAAATALELDVLEIDRATRAGAKDAGNEAGRAAYCRGLPSEFAGPVPAAHADYAVTWRRAYKTGHTMAQLSR